MSGWNARHRVVGWLAVVALGALLPSTAGAQSPAAESATTCRAVEVPDTVGGTAGAIAGTLCVPPGPVIVPLVDLYSQAVEPVPGLGSQANPIPLSGEFLATVSNLNDQVLGTLPHELTAGVSSRTPPVGSDQTTRTIRPR